MVDPPHEIVDVTLQIYGNPALEGLVSPVPMDGFVINTEKVFPGYGKEALFTYNTTTANIFRQLADEFSIFDAWHASLPGPTHLNRAFLLSCTTNGLGNTGTTTISPALLAGFPQKTIFDAISETGNDWAVYYEFFPSALFFDNVRLHLDKLHTLQDFYDGLTNGNLPYFSYIEPRYYDIGDLLADDCHPPHGIAEGQNLVKSIYEAMRSSSIWGSSALIITFDEHGGFFDHVPTPLNIPNPDGKVSTDPPFNFTRLGVRVPTIIVSPWVKKGTVVHRAVGPMSNSEYEHSSVAATLKKILGFPNFLTNRDAWAGTFENIFLNLSSPRTDCPVTLEAVIGTSDLTTIFLNDWQGILLAFLSSLVGENINVGDFNVNQAVNYIKEKLDQFLNPSSPSSGFSFLGYSGAIAIGILVAIIVGILIICIGIACVVKKLKVT
jgi:phospholipase C